MPGPPVVVVGDGPAGLFCAYELTRQAIGYRMLQLLQLPLATMSEAELKRALTDIAGS